MTKDDVRTFAAKRHVSDIYVLIVARDRYGGNLNDILRLYDQGIIAEQVEKAIKEDRYI